MNKTILITAAILLALAVALGAFGAHALKDKLTEEMVRVYQTGVQYHFYHALGMLLVGMLTAYKTSKYLNWSAWLLVAGILLFSGSLYILAITGIKGLGAVTPFGGVSFIVGWVLLAIGILKGHTQIEK